MRFLAACWTQIWITLVVGLVMLALYTSVGRQLIPLVETWRPDVEKALSDLTGKPVSIGRIEGDWRYLSPVVRLVDVEVGEGDSAISLAMAEAELDVSASAFYQLPVFKRIELDGLKANLRRDQQNHLFSGDWQLYPLPERVVEESEPRPKRSSAESPQPDRPLWVRLLELQQRVELEGWQLALTNPDGKTDRLHIKQWLWRHQGNSQSVLGHVAWGRQQLADISINATLNGQVWPWAEQDGEIVANVEPQSWTRWIPDDLPMGLKFNQLDAGAEVWVSLKQGKLDRVYADLALSQLDLTTNQQPLKLDSGRIRIGGQLDGSDWHMRVKPELGESVPLDDFSISLVHLNQPAAEEGQQQSQPEPQPRQSQRGWQLGLAELQLGQAVDYLLDHGLLPSPFDRYLENIQPGGKATDVRLSFLPGSEELVDVRAQIHDVHGQSYMGIPGISGLDGSLHLQPSKGKIRFDDEDVVVDLEGVYEQPWDMDDLSGQFQWQIEPEASRIWLTDIKARWNHLHLRSELSLYLPSRASGRPLTLALLLGMPEANVTDRSRILPDLLEPELRSWLDSAILAGKLSNGAFMLNGDLNIDHPENSLTTQLYLDIADGELEYMPDWPLVYGVDGRMLLDTPRVDGWLEHGRTLGGTLVKDSGRIRLNTNPGQLTQLKVSGQLQGDSREAIRYFTDTPLQQVVNNAFDYWQPSGPMKASMQLQMPLGDPNAAPDVHIDVDLDGNQLALQDLNINISNLTGPFEYDTATGVSSPEFTASVMGGDLYARLESQPVVGAEGAFKINLNGRGEAGMAEFKQWMPMFLLDPVSGSLAYQAQLKLNTGSGDVLFALDTDLQGTTIDYPAPLAKAGQEADHNLHVEVRPGRETRISMNYDDMMRGVFALDQNGLDRGQVYLGGGEPFLPSDRGVEIRGSVDQPISAEAWWTMWERLLPLAEAEEAAQTGKSVSSGGTSSADSSITESATNSTSEQQNPLRLVDLRFVDIDAWTVPTGPAVVKANQNWGEWLFSIDSTLAKGDVTLAADDSPVDIKMTYLHLPEPAADPDGVTPQATQNAAAVTAGKPKTPQPLAEVLAEDSLIDMVPADLLAMNVDVREFMIGGWNFGSWNMSTRPIDGGMTITVNDSNMKGLKITGDARWLKTETGHKTSLDMLQISGNDVGKVLRAFRQEPIMEGKRLKSSVSMNWQGSPMAFNTQSLNGLASIRVEDGSWKTEGAGALKAFGALNFNSISRRLKLDFSDLYQSGVAFDVTKAKAKIENGIMTFTEPLVVDGPGAKMLASGTANLSTEALDLKLAVTFPVTGSLPLVAVLAGFAAPIAGAIYVTEKLIGDELERFTSASYDVKGTFSKPDMKIREAFDNDVDGKRVRSFKERFLSIFGLEESK